MPDFFSNKIAWRRRGVCRHYVGTLRAGDGGIRLAGRDPVSGVEIALSIPFDEIEYVHVSAADELLAGEHCVVLDLAESESILLREVGVGPFHVRALARALDRLTHKPLPLSQGG